MGKSKKTTLEQRLKILKDVMQESTAEELVASISMLPFIREDGLRIMFATTATVLKENFNEDAYDTVLQQLKEITRAIKEESGEGEQ